MCWGRVNVKREHLFVIAGMALVLSVVLLAPLASSFPDGLEKASEVHGFVGKASVVFKTAMSDYRVPFVVDKNASTVVAGTIGAFLVFAFVYIAGRVLTRKRKEG